MNERKPVHSGHRERMKEKLVNFPESLSDHELLEILTYYSIPRRDTNVTAHELLSVLGDLNGVFSAKKEELTFIQGVGDNTAVLIRLVAELARRIKEGENKAKEYYGFNEYRQEIADYFKDKRATEEFIVVMFDKNHKKVGQISFNCDEEYEVSIDTNKLNDAFLRYSPKFLILAHNHTSGNAEPSEKDKDATTDVLLFAKIHGAKVLDHIIVAGEKMYSFFREDALKDAVTDKEVRRILKQIKE